MSVTCNVCTKNRYDLLPLTLVAIALQTTKPDHVIIVDDTDNPTDIRTLPPFQSALQLFNVKGIGWEVMFGRKLGQHHSHQMVQEKATTDFIWRVDDDEIPEPNVLEELLSQMRSDVGAVGGLVPQGILVPAPPAAANLISDLNRPNVQWFNSQPHEPVEHLHSTFLYRRGIVDYELHLSPSAHREETLFTHEFVRRGYKLIVNRNAVTWHFPSQQGGIRSHQQHPEWWDDDEKLFQDKLREWGITTKQTKTIVLDCGRGDHVMVKSLLPRLKEKYGKVVIGSCYPDIFADDDVEQISISEAKQRLGNIDRFSIYRWCIDHNWTGNLVTAFEKLYALG